MTDSAPPASEIRLNTPLLPIIVIILLFLVITDGYRGWVVLLIAFGGIWLLCYFWARALANGLQIRREIRLGWAQVGDRLEERFTLINLARVPALWVEVIGQTNMPDYWANQVRSVRREAETRWQIRGLCTHRGVYTLGPTTIKTNDPFSIYTVTLHNPVSATLVVTPPVVPLPPIQVTPGGRAGEGVQLVKAFERSVNTTGVREYMPGDSMRWIHWPTSARRNDFFVRVFERTLAGDWWIVLDLDQRVQVGEGKNSTQEHSIILAASLADFGMRNGRSVGLVAHGDELVWHYPQMSDEHKWEMLRSLAFVKTGNVNLTKLLEVIRPAATSNASLIIITPALNGERLTALLELRRLGVILTVLLFDPQSFGSLQASSNLSDDLVKQGITHQIIPRELLEGGESQPEPEKNGGWRDSPNGRVVPLPGKEGFSWRNLGRRG